MFCVLQHLSSTLSVLVWHQENEICCVAVFSRIFFVGAEHGWAHNSKQRNRIHMLEPFSSEHVVFPIYVQCRMRHWTAKFMSVEKTKQLFWVQGQTRCIKSTIFFSFQFLAEHKNRRIVRIYQCHPFHFNDLHTARAVLTASSKVVDQMKTLSYKVLLANIVILR